MDACGIYTTKQASPTKDFDRLMAHFAAIAGDEAWARRAAEGDERRLRYLIGREIERGTVTAAYVIGIARNMGFLPASASTLDSPRSTIDALPADHLWRIWNALLRHNARHGKQQVSGESQEVRNNRAPAYPAEVSAEAHGAKEEAVSRRGTARGRTPKINAPLPF
jgi:hypothetical protein